jgi:hypothetical protein
MYHVRDSRAISSSGSRCFGRQPSSRLRAAQPLVQRIAAGPGAKFGDDFLGGNDFRFNIPGAEAFSEGARDAADGKPFDRRAI